MSQWRGVVIRLRYSAYLLSYISNLSLADGVRNKEKKNAASFGATSL